MVGPDDLAGVNLAGKDGHRPFVVPFTGVALLVRFGPATIGRTPQTGVAGGCINELQLRIVAEPRPKRCATDLPVIARVGRDAQVLAVGPVMRIGFVGVRRETDILVRTGAVAAPHLLAGLEIVGCEAASRGELVAAEAGDHQVLGD